MSAKIKSGRNPRYTSQQMIFIIVATVLLLSLIQMAMQLYIFEKARSGVADLERIEATGNQRLKERGAQVLNILHNQEQIENATNATLAKMFKMESSGK